MQDLRVALSKPKPRIDLVVENFNQSHTSHYDCVCVCVLVYICVM